jgi:hypothetical protein
MEAEPMRARLIRWIGSLALASGALAAFSWTHGQEQSSAPPPSGVPSVSSLPPSGSSRPIRDVSKFSPLQQQMLLSMQRGADWLYRANGTDGRFIYGLAPALRTGLEGDHYLRQVGAAFALAQAARFRGDDRYAARARQAVLTLLADTAVDPAQPGIRSTTLPPGLANRLAAAGLLVLAVHELPSPADDLLEEAEQLCAYLRSRQQADGSLRYHETAEEMKNDPEGINHYPGLALYGLMLSQRHRPAAWKTELVRKALQFYLPWWRGHRNMVFVPWQTAAYAEAFAVTQDKVFADAVFEMNDWLGEMQYPLLDPRHPLWGGGFMGWMNGKSVWSAPSVHSAVYVEGLADAGRVARQLSDLPRYQKYREQVERGLQFLARLQYTDANTQHFADWYRPSLVGAFHASHQDGNIRIDYTQQAVSALVQYLTYVVE